MSARNKIITYLSLKRDLKFVLLTLCSAHSFVLQCELRIALGGGSEEAHIAVVLFRDIAFTMR